MEADTILAAVEKAKRHDAYFELSDEERAAIDKAINELLLVYHADDHNLILPEERATESGDAQAGGEHDEHRRSRRTERNQDLMPGLTWDHTENIALALYEKFPDLDPTHIRYTDLHQWITELEDFKDDPKGSTEGKLEAIQMAWLEEYQEDHE